MTTPTTGTPATLSPITATPAQLLFGDLAQEIAATRRVLERVPEGHTDWRPHGKSMTLGRLATHIAELPRFATTIPTTDELDFDSIGYTPVTLATTAEVVALFDAESARMRAAIEAMTWEMVTQRWVMRGGGQVWIDGQKGQLIRTFGISHIAHHRAQLGVYLRLLDVAVPSVYGPSADEM